MKKSLLIISIVLFSGLLLAGCTPTNPYFYEYDRGDCKPTKYDDADENLDLNLRWRDDSLYLRWDGYEGDDFEGYYVMRDDSLTCPYYYSGSDYYEYIGKKSRTYYKDEEVESGETYYYRLCVKQTDKEISCGGVKKVEIY